MPEFVFMPMVMPRSGCQNPTSVYEQTKSKSIHRFILVWKSFETDKASPKCEEILFDSSLSSQHSYKAQERESNMNSCRISHSNFPNRQLLKNSTGITNCFQILLGRLKTSGLLNWISGEVDLWLATCIKLLPFAMLQSNILLLLLLFFVLLVLKSEFVMLDSKFWSVKSVVSFCIFPLLWFSVMINSPSLNESEI